MKTQHYEFAPSKVTKPKKKGWQTHLKEILDANNHLKAEGNKSASYKTRNDREANLFKIFYTLTKDLKYGIEDPRNLKVKHVEALIAHWKEKELSAGTIETYVSCLRTLCGWMNKPGMILPLFHYAPDLKRTYASQHDKSFTGSEVDFWKVWNDVNVVDKHTAMHLLLIKAFGMRREEAIQFKPIIHDIGTAIQVFDGPKGGRPRLVPIQNDFQMAVLAACKNFALATGNPKKHMGHPDKTLAQEKRRYDYVMEKVGLTKKDKGVTGHGLRAEYAIDRMIEGGIMPTVRGGAGLGAGTFDDRAAALRVSESLGHSRLSVMPAYGGKWIIAKTTNAEGKECYGLEEIPSKLRQGPISLEESRRELEVKEHNDKANLRMVNTAINASRKPKKGAKDCVEEFQIRLGFDPE